MGSHRTIGTKMGERSEAKRLRELESENNKLKKLLAEKLLENEAMKDVLSKKW